MKNKLIYIAVFYYLLFLFSILVKKIERIGKQKVLRPPFQKFLLDQLLQSSKAHLNLQ